MSERPTLLDVARRAGVSRSTASRVLAGSSAISATARDQVMSAAEELGYLPDPLARALRTRRSMLVGLVLNNLSNATFHVIATVLQSRLHEHGYQVLLCVTNADPEVERRYLNTLRDHRVDGVVIIGTGANHDALSALVNSGVPLINLVRANDDAPGQRLLAKDFEGAYKATRHLLGLGHRRIALIRGPQSSNSGRDRHAGYEAAMRESGASVDPALVVQGPFEPEFGRAAMEKLAAGEVQPTALYVSNHEASFGVLPWLAARDVAIPTDMSVVCHDEADWFAYWKPPITIVSSQPEALANLCCDRLIATMAPDQIAPPTGAEPSAQLIVRGSTAQLTAGQ